MMNNSNSNNIAPRSQEDTAVSAFFSRGFLGECLVHCGDKMVKMEDLKEGDVVATGCRKQPTAEVRKIHKSPELSGARAVKVRPGLSVVAAHPIKTAEGPRGTEGLWMPAMRMASGPGSGTTAAVVYNLELAGHVDTLLVAGLICAVRGTYCGPQFGWDLNTRKTTRCRADECKDERDEFTPHLTRCMYCDIVHEAPLTDKQAKLQAQRNIMRKVSQQAQSPIAAVPAALREACGHGAYGEPVTYSNSFKVRHGLIHVPTPKL